MISAICNKNELRIQEMSQFLCVGCVGCVLAVRVQGKKHTSRGTPKSAKSITSLPPSYQYVLSGDDICNLQQKLAQNSRDERIGMCGMCWICESEPKHTPSGVETTVQKLARCFTRHKNYVVKGKETWRLKLSRGRYSHTKQTFLFRVWSVLP